MKSRGLINNQTIPDKLKTRSTRCQNSEAELRGRLDRNGVATHCVAVGQDLTGLGIRLYHDTHRLLIQLDQIMQIVIAKPAHVSFVSWHDQAVVVTKLFRPHAQSVHDLGCLAFDVLRRVFVYMVLKHGFLGCTCMALSLRQVWHYCILG